MDAIYNLAAHTFRRAEDVSIILRKSTHTHQAMQRAGQLRAIACAKFCVAQRQFAVRTLRGFIDAYVKRAVHWLQPELCPFKLSRREHHVCVVLFVPAYAPKLSLG